ncbi:hypothetical protein IAI18_06085 [Acetobacteraceae bacterium H6797]|nr:hypothetical protein [Acetobacteraceae bacterium H6797]
MAGETGLSPGELQALAYLSRRNVPPVWRDFTAALVERLDAVERGDMLRGVGRAMAETRILGEAATLGELEARMNEALASLDWGFVGISLLPEVPALRLTHSGAPAIALPGDPHGRWFGLVLEGLYRQWLAALPAAGPEARLVVTHAEEGRVILEYRRG